MSRIHVLPGIATPPDREDTASLDMFIAREGKLVERTLGVLICYHREASAYHVTQMSIPDNEVLQSSAPTIFIHRKSKSEDLGDRETALALTSLIRRVKDSPT